jgi:hypothetical protein
MPLWLRNGLFEVFFRDEMGYDRQIGKSFLSILASRPIRLISPWGRQFALQDTDKLLFAKRTNCSLGAWRIAF